MHGSGDRQVVTASSRKKTQRTSVYDTRWSREFKAAFTPVAFIGAVRAPISGSPCVSLISLGYRRSIDGPRCRATIPPLSPSALENVHNTRFRISNSDYARVLVVKPAPVAKRRKAKPSSASVSFVRKHDQVYVCVYVCACV